MKIHERLSPLARKLCYYHDGIVIGGSVDYLIGKSNKRPKDIDIIIEPSKFRVVLIEFKEEDFVLNSFGGFKIQDCGFVLDVWPDTLERLIRTYPRITALFPINEKVVRTC